MTVTALTALRRGRVGLHLEGSFVCALHPDVAAELQPGDEVGDTRLEELQSRSNLLFAKSQALRLLSIRPHGCQELYQKLSANWGEQAAAASVSRMLELGYLDDREYAARYARELVRKGRARDRILRELIAKGIDRELAEEVLEEEPQDLEAAAAQVIQKKYRNSLEDEKGLRRTQNALARLGYPYDVIRTVIRHLREDEDYYDDTE